MHAVAMWDWVSFWTVLFFPIVSVANFKEEAENSIFSKLPIANFIHRQFCGKLPIPMKYWRQRPELSIDEPLLGGLGAELWSPKNVTH
jgi:hypothetical protein